jgi:hypothetical protein
LREPAEVGDVSLFAEVEFSITVDVEADIPSRSEPWRLTPQAICHATGFAWLAKADGF